MRLSRFWRCAGPNLEKWTKNRISNTPALSELEETHMKTRHTLNTFSMVYESSKFVFPIFKFVMNLFRGRKNIEDALAARNLTWNDIHMLKVFNDADEMTAGCQHVYKQIIQHLYSAKNPISNNDMADLFDDNVQDFLKEGRAQGNLEEADDCTKVSLILLGEPDVGELLEYAKSNSIGAIRNCDHATLNRMFENEVIGDTIFVQKIHAFSSIGDQIFRHDEFHMSCGFNVRNGFTTDFKVTHFENHFTETKKSDDGKVKVDMDSIPDIVAKEAARVRAENSDEKAK